MTTFDLVLLGLVLLFALWGAFQGAARQVAQTIAAIGAWLAARPVGDALGPFAAQQAHLSLVVGTVLATFVAFIFIFVIVRYILTRILRRVLAGKDPTNRTADRLLGFVMGAAKVSLLAWVVVCALSFLEENVSLQGRRFNFIPKDSVALSLARKYNLFEMSQFAGVTDVVRVARVQADPKKATRLKESSDFQALMKDARFTSMLDTAAMKKALGGGDTRPLLQNNGVLQLLQDPLAMKRITRIAELSEQ